MKPNPKGGAPLGNQNRAVHIEGFSIEGIPQFCASTGYSRPFVKAMQGTQAGAAAVIRNRFKVLAFVRAVNSLNPAQTELLDNTQEQAALAKARREEIEDQTKIRRGEMHVLADVEKVVWEKALLPTREAMLQMSRICAAQCNPADPALAQKVLDAYVARLLKNIRESIPAEVEEKNIGDAIYSENPYARH